METYKKDLIVDGKINLDECHYGKIQINGKGSSNYNVDAEEFVVNGKFKTEAKIDVKGKFVVSGKCKLNILSSDSVFVKGRIEANKILAKNIIIEISGESLVSEIECDCLTIECRSLSEIESKIGNLVLNIFGENKDFNKIIGTAKMSSNRIKAKNINISNVVANEVIAESVNIGDNCAINVLKYSGVIRISEKSIVKSLIRI